jgi:type I restriction enzyme S subunit
MIADLKPYPEYKEAGLPGLGQVPGHWEIKRLGSLGRFSASGIDKKTLSGEPLVRMINYLDIYKNPTHELWATKNLMVVSCPEDKKRIHDAKQGDMFFTPSSETSKDIGWSAVAMEDLPETVYSYHVIRFRTHETIDLLFRRYWCNNVFVLNQFSLASRGTTRKILDRGDFRRIVSLVPPGVEQTAIGRFLDWATGRLERAIRAKRKVIALLNEQKQAIIHRAVTRGLDPSVPLKPSGIPWLGDIPQHWEMLRAKYLYREIDERSIEGSEELLSVSHITGVTPRSQKNITMFKAASYSGHKLCQPGDLVVNTMWAWMGALGVSTHAGIISPAYAVYRPRRTKNIVGIYMDGLLRSRPYVSNIICRSTGLRASRLRLYPEEFFRLSIIQPPADEQQRIVETIQGESSGLDTSISRLEREIELLREYRTRLVADVVTGKLDVREAAARLPQEAFPDTVEDEIDLTDDPEVADEEVVV